MKYKLITVSKYAMMGACVLLVISLISNISRTRQMRSVIDEAQLSLMELQTKQQELQHELQLTEGDYFVEKEARNKLGLVKSNETVLVLPDEETLKKLSPIKDKVVDEYKLPDANWKKWLELFEVETES